MGDFTSLTAEDVERLQSLYQGRADHLADKDNEPAGPLPPEDDDVLGGGMSEWQGKGNGVMRCMRHCFCMLHALLLSSRWTAAVWLAVG
jgi:hypothetical protein